MINSEGGASNLPVSFPSEFEESSVKGTKEYGLKYAKAIWNSYFNSGGYTIERRKIQELKRWAEGRQSVVDMKKLWGTADGDVSYANLDWSAPSIVAHFVDVLLGLFLNQQFKPQCKAVDNISLTKKDAEYRKLRAAHILKGADAEFIKAGIPPIVPPNTKQFDTIEELDLYFELTFKQAVEVAMELGIEVVMSNNDYEELRKDVLKNLIIQKNAGIRVFYSNQNTIRLKSLDPEFLILPYTQKPDHRDANYWGYVDFMSVGELKQQAGDQFTDNQYRQMAKGAGGQWANPIWQDNYWNAASYQYLNFLIPVMEFEFLSLNAEQLVFKETISGKRVFQKDMKYNPENAKANNHKVERNDIQQKYNGFYVVGTDFVYNYGMSKNMIFQRINNTYAAETPLSAIIYTPDVYENTNKGLVERMLPHAKQCHLALLKMQQIQAEAAPKGIEIDLEGTTGIKIGAGDDAPDVGVMQLINLYKQKGTFLTRRINDDGTAKNGKVIQELENGMSRDLERYMNSYNFHKNEMREMIAVNPAVDASTISNEAAVGIQKLQVNATINALRPLKSGYVNIMQRACNNVALMIQDSLRYGNGAKDIFINSLGNRTLEVLEAVKDIPLVDYAITIQYEQDEQERQDFNETVQLCLQQGLIEPSDVWVLKTITNTKVAYAFLKERERKLKKQKAEEAAMNSKMQSEGSVQAAQAAEQARMETEMMLKKATSELEMVKADLAESNEKLKSELRIQEMETEYRLKKELAVVIETTRTTSDNKMVQTSDTQK